MGLIEILTVLFIALKLAGVGAVAAWPWVWVLSPFWIGYGILLGIFALAFGLRALGRAL